MSDNAIASIRQVVDEHQSSVILSSSCLKTQKCLLKKLKEQLESQKVERNFINKSNMRLEMEIKLDEQKLNSLHIAVNTIQSANVEAKKEYLLIKELRSDDNQRIKNGIIKYEKEWALAKEKYENIPYIKEYLEIKNRIQASQDKLKALLNQSNELYTQINKKRREVFTLDKGRVLKLAQFIVKDRSMYIRMICENEEEKRRLSDTIKQMKETENVPSAPPNIEVDVHTAPESRPANADLQLPSIKLQSVDLDVLSDRLNQIKKIEIAKHNEIANMPFKDQQMNTPHIKHDYISSYFDLCNITKADTKDYSNKKLINILDDIKLNENETKEIIAKVIPSKLLDVNVISKDRTAVDPKAKDFGTKKVSERLSQKTPIETGEIEEIDITASNSQGQIVLPPTQFMDLTQEPKFKPASEDIVKDGTSRLSQEKKVSFDENGPENMEIDNSFHNTSDLSNNSYTNVKDMILKKYNLDLSPQFVYSKNTLQTKPKETIVTSKFFEVKDQQEVPKEHVQIIDKDKQNYPESTECQPVASTSQYGEAAKSVEGLLFVHGPHGLMESLELSCTENAEGDSEYLHGVDSSLLMSPKADDMPSDRDENKSEGISNFLAGIKKSGFSFFGSGDPNQDTAPASQENNNFTFSFGETKKKGGLFSMFR